MKKIIWLVLMSVSCSSLSPTNSVYIAARDYLSKTLYDPASLIIDRIAPIDTLTVGESLQKRIEETDPSAVSITICIDFAENLSPAEQTRRVDERTRMEKEKMSVEHRELLQLKESLADRLDDILAVTYEIKFRANDVEGNPVSYERVFRTNPEGRITEMATDVGSLYASIDIIAYNRLQNKLYNEIYRWDNLD